MGGDALGPAKSAGPAGPEGFERIAVAFARVLTGAGVTEPVGSVISFVEALGAVGVDRRSVVYWAGRATLVRRPEHIAVYDRVFESFWLDRATWAALPPQGSPMTVAFDDDEGTDGGDAPSPDEESCDPTVAVRYSATEVLRHKDLASLNNAEWSEAARLLALLRTTADLRRSRRLRRGRRSRGHPDLRVTLRRAMRTDGEVVRPGRKAPSQRPRRLVLIADVSGSMEPYARAMLRFAQAAVAARGPGRVEAFALGTRLTRLTRELGGRDPDVAVRRAAATVVDYSGGTRLGEGLRAFNDRWGARGLARGAVVVIVSDGWDRGDPADLGEEMGRLARVAHRVVWVNPLKASPGYEPLARGMAAALPHVDQFVEGHSLAALEELAVLIGGKQR
ncbi:MAG: VWA domain-containing protein [Actinomycetota bacterium]|nr:VWA domain-containing protein [Actinomycetota bacterium]MDQ6947327.1 VWA domain-containing protein [Actinomycetota bacterium]